MLFGTAPTTPSKTPPREPGYLPFSGTVDIFKDWGLNALMELQEKKLEKQSSSTCRDLDVLTCMQKKPQQKQRQDHLSTFVITFSHSLRVKRSKNSFQSAIPLVVLLEQDGTRFTSGTPKCSDKTERMEEIPNHFPDTNHPQSFATRCANKGKQRSFSFHGISLSLIVNSSFVDT